MKLETFSFDIDSDGIAHAVFDVPGRSMNTLTGKAVADIIAFTQEVATNDAIKGLVISSGKASGFCAGADLGEMGDRAGSGGSSEPKSEAEIKKAQFDAGFSLNKTLRQLETCGKPVAVALNGLALGGGLEVALAGSQDRPPAGRRRHTAPATPRRCADGPAADPSRRKLQCREGARHGRRQ